MAIDKIHIFPTTFKANTPITKTKSSSNTNNTNVTNSIQHVTPDFAVKTPQKYIKLGEVRLANGLTMHSYKLANGHKVSIIPMVNSPATVKNYVNVGSMNETDDIKGISHFLEHMAFNGTNGSEGYLKLNRGDSFKQIDALGGWTNASTNYAITDYVNSTPLLNKNDLEKQIQIISSMTEDLAIAPDMIEKEKHPVSSEIDMILDNPQTIAIDQTIRSLFNIRSSADELVGGSVKHIQELNREKVLEYYDKYYTPDNMHLVITGNINPENTINMVSKHFHSNKTSNKPKYEEKLLPISNSVRKDFITNKATSAEIVFGFAGPTTSNIKDSIITEIIAKYLNSTDAGINKELNKLNASSAFGQEKISTNPSSPIFLYYMANCSDKNSEEVTKLLIDKISELKAPDGKKLQNIKNGLLQNFNDGMELSENVNTLVGWSAFDNNVEYLTNYNNILKSITTSDINNYIDKYVDTSKVAITIIHPNTDKQTIEKNYEQVNRTRLQSVDKSQDSYTSPSFKGLKNITNLNNQNAVQPLESDKITQSTLANNYKLSFIESNNQNTPFIIGLHYKLPQNVNPAAYYVLNDILSKGTANSTEDEFTQFKEDNNIDINAILTSTNLVIAGNGNAENLAKTIEKVNEIIKEPRINDNEIKKSIDKILDNLSRNIDTSKSIYSDYEAKNNPYLFSKEDIINGLESLTTEDVKNLHKYILENSYGAATINIPDNLPAVKTIATHYFSKLPQIKPYENYIESTYIKNDETEVLTKPRNTSQADISETFKFKYDNSIKTEATVKIMNSILSSSDSIGLFNNLREKEHLAYTVNSNTSHFGNNGIVSLRILTSTDNVDTGVKTYDNVQKSINGFNKQLKQLVNSEYTDQDLENAKMALKAELLNKETVISRIKSISKAQFEDGNLTRENDLYKVIDSITREDIDNLSREIFNSNPVYSIVASKNTLEYNKDFLNSLKG